MENLKLQRSLLIKSSIAFILFVLIFFINYFRFELLGIVPGYAPHNFVFNLSFFLPALFISFCYSLFIFGNILIRWKKLPNLWIKFIMLILTSIFPLYIIIRTAFI